MNKREKLFDKLEKETNRKILRALFFPIKHRPDGAGTKRGDRGNINMSEKEKMC